MRTIRVCFLSLAVFLCLSAPGLAQSNAKRDYSHQHKDAQKYQKSLIKERHKQEKAAAKTARGNRAHHE